MALMTANTSMNNAKVHAAQAAMSTIINGSLTVNGSGSAVNHIGSPISNQNAIYMNNGNHTHTFSGGSGVFHSPYIPVIVNVDNQQNMIYTKEGNEVLTIKNGEIQLNKNDNLAVEDLISVFKYIQDDYPNLYADLILKGIIK